MRSPRFLWTTPTPTILKSLFRNFQKNSKLKKMNFSKNLKVGAQMRSRGFVSNSNTNNSQIFSQNNSQISFSHLESCNPVKQQHNLLEKSFIKYETIYVILFDNSINHHNEHKLLKYEDNCLKWDILWQMYEDGILSIFPYMDIRIKFRPIYVLLYQWW